MTVWEQISAILGLRSQAQELTFFQIALRGVIMFFAILIMLRCSHKRFLAKRNTLDTLLTFLLASMLARAVNGSERFFPSIGGGFIIVFLHRFMAWATCRFSAFGKFIKGESSILVESGRINQENLKKHHVSEDDLKEDVRLSAGSDDISKIRKARLERNGEISVESQK